MNAKQKQISLIHTILQA